MADTSREGSPSTDRELAETVSAVESGRVHTGLAPSGAVRALLEMSPTQASGPATDVHVEIGAAGDLEPGTLLDESYRVIEVLGRGGMGTVYLVEHTRLGRRFAAKVIADALASDVVLVARLHAEARVASKIRHENIVDVTHLGQTPRGALFVVMELLEGRDLRARLEDDDAKHGLPFAEVRALADDLFAGLAAAHAQGVVHRDLKPENVFLATSERGVRAKIVDFGIAKAGPSEGDMRLTQTGQVIGTPLYMSPEQSRDTASVDARSDQYSLGILLYEMLTGRRPFEARNPYELVVMHATEVPRPLRLLRDDVPAGVESVVLRCLEKLAKARFADVTALRDAWRAAWEAPREAAAPHVAPTPPTPPPSAASSDPGMRAVTAGFVSALVLAGLGGLWMATRGGGDEPASSPVAAVHDDAAVGAPDAAVLAPDAWIAALGVTPPIPATRRVITRPEGASVSIDGQPICTTPCDVTLGAEGTARISIQLRGHRREERTLTLEDPEELTISLRTVAVREGTPREGPPPLAPR